MGGWEVEFRLGKVVWIDEMYVFYGMLVGLLVIMELVLVLFLVDFRVVIEDVFNCVIKEGKVYCYEGFLNCIDG